MLVDRRIEKLMLAAAATSCSALIMLSATPALANTCGSGTPSSPVKTYLYGQYNSAWDTNGIRGYLSTDGLAIPNGDYSTAHMLPHIGEVTENSYPSCNQSTCQAQVGYGLGIIGADVASSLYPYIEVQDLEPYQASFKRSYSLQQETYYYDDWDGNTFTINGIVAGEYPLWICDPNCSVLAYGYLPNWNAGNSQAVAVESFTNYQMTCPSANQYEYVGTGNSYVQVSKSSSQNWVNWGSNEANAPTFQWPYANESGSTLAWQDFGG